jgi:hypothetical protein
MLNYLVVIDVVPVRNDFPGNYFPRGFHYKREANELVAEVKGKDGSAHVVPKSQFTPELLKQWMKTSGTITSTPEQRKAT